MRTIQGLGAILVVSMFGCLALAAQDAAKKEAKPAGGQAMSMPMPKPAPEMTKMIKMMAGNWKVAEMAEPGPMSPSGGTGEGMAKLWPGPGGMSLMETYHSKGVMGPNFSGAGTFWWDSKAQVYKGIWCDTMTEGGCDNAGTSKWDGDKLVGMMESEMNGQKMYMRLTYSDFKPDSFVFTMDSGPSPTQMKKFMTMTYTRMPGGGKM